MDDPIRARWMLLERNWAGQSGWMGSHTHIDRAPMMTEVDMNKLIDLRKIFGYTYMPQLELTEGRG